MNRFESPHCTFVVPEDWERDPPFGFTRPAEAGGRWSAQAREYWLSSLSGAEFMRLQREALFDQHEEFDLMEERTLPADGAQEGRLFVARCLDEGGEPARAWFLYRSRGPLVCELALSGPPEPERDTARLFEAISKTFTLRDTELLPPPDFQIPGGKLLPPQPPGESVGPRERRKFPRACVALPVLPGWELEAAEGQPVYRRNDAEITLARVLDSDGDPDAWFAAKVQELRATGSALLAVERGETSLGDFLAILYEEGGLTRTWRSAGSRQSLQVLLNGLQPLLWTLSATPRGFWDLRGVLASLIAATEFLPSPEWELRLPEEWMRLTLQGAWHVEGKSVYRYAGDNPVFLHLSRQGVKQPLSELRPTLIELFRRGSPLEFVRSEDEALGSWKGSPALHYSADGRTSEGDSLSLRATWIAEERLLHHVLVFGADLDAVEDLAARTVEAVVL